MDRVCFFFEIPENTAEHQVLPAGLLICSIEKVNLQKGIRE